MFREWAADHFFQYLVLMVVMALVLGVVASYCISFILAIQKITEIFFMTWTGGSGG